MYFVCQRARQDVKVALIGQGPDELFGGYKRHLGVHYGEWWRGLPGGLRSMIGLAVNGLPRNEMLKRGIHSLGVEDRLNRYQDVFSLAPAETINGLFRDGVLPEKQDNYDLVEYWARPSPANGAFRRARRLSTPRGPLFASRRTAHVCRQVIHGA